MRIHVLAAAAALSISAVPAFAEFQKIEEERQFVAIVAGKELKRPLVSLEVSPEGRISGTGAAWPVEGSWKWQNGFFCRELFWGGDALGYNCQEVEAAGDRIRFTSDQGKGDSAEFRLR